MAPAIKIDPLSPGREQIIRYGEAVLLLNCGDGLAARWQAAGLPAAGPTAVLFTDGGVDCIGGLYSFLAAMRDARRHQPLTLLHNLTDERVGYLVGAFLQGEGADYDISLDADLPGRSNTIGPFLVEMRAAPMGVGFRVKAGGETIELRSGYDA